MSAPVDEEEAPALTTAPAAEAAPGTTSRTGRLRAVLQVLARPRVRAVLALVLLGVVVWRLGAGPFLAGIRSLDLPAVGAALGIGALTTVAGAWRWTLVAGRLGMPLRLRAAVVDCYQALFLNTVLPAGVLGDVGRVVAHGRAVGDVGRSARAVMIEKAAGQVVLVLAGTAVLLAEPALLRVLGIPPQVWGPAIGLLAVGAVVALGVRRLRTALGVLLADVRRAGGAWFGVGALSLVALTGYVGLFLVAARATGTAAPVLTVLPLLLVALFVMGLPVSVGGFGPREAVAALAFAAVGLGAAQGLSAAVAYGVLTMVSTLPGALVLLARRGRLGRTASPAA